MKNYNTREEWLTAAMDLIIEKIFVPNDLRLPQAVKISAAPLRCKPSIPGEKPQGVYGECWKLDRSDDGSNQIFINTVLGNDDVVEILSTIVHELCHSVCYADGHEDAKHGFPFRDHIRTVGLAGKPKSTYAEPGSELFATLQAFAVELGDYPHSPLRPAFKKTRQSEILTYVSESDPDYQVKLKITQVLEKGVPKDPGGQPMIPKDQEKFLELEEIFGGETPSDEETEEAAE